MTQVQDRAATTPTPQTDRLGLPQSTALVMGSIIGVGIFSLPYAIASYGPISLVAMGIATVGAIALAMMFAVHVAAAARRRRTVRLRPGCLRQRARASATPGPTGSPPGPATPPSRSAGSSTSRSFVNKGGAVGWSIVIALVGLWIPAAVNLTGVRNMGVFQLWTHGAQVHPAGPDVDGRALLHHRRQLHALEHQRRQQPLRHRRRDGDLPVQLPRRRDRLRRGSQGARPGAQRRALDHLSGRSPAASSTCSRWWPSSGSCPPAPWPWTATRRRTPQPPTPSSGTAPGPATWWPWPSSSPGIGALNGWTMIVRRDAARRSQGRTVPQALRRSSPSGECPRSGSSPRPRSPPLAVVISYLGTSGATVFTTLVLMTGITSAIPYAFSALAQIKWRWRDHQRGHTPRFVLDLGGRRRRVRRVARVHLLLPQHRQLLVRRVGPVPDGRRRRPSLGIPVYLRDARLDDRARARPRLPMTVRPTTPDDITVPHTERTPMTFHVDSEVGLLKQAIVHRPGLELSRLTPANVDELLFDDVMWADRAREEHDAFVAQLEASGVEVHQFATLLAEALDRARRPRVRPGPADHGHPVRPGSRHAARRAGRLDSGTRCSPSLLIGGVLKTRRRLTRCTTPSLLMEYLRAGRLPAAAAAEPPVPARQLRLGLRRRLGQPDGQARPQARDDQLPGGLQLPPDVPRRRRSLPLRQRLAGPRAGHHRGRRHHRHRQPRGHDRHGRALHPPGRRDPRLGACSAPAPSTP